MAIFENSLWTFWRDRNRFPVQQINRSVDSSRSHTVPVNRRHPRQHEFRAALNSILFLWRALTSGQRATWNTFATANQSTNKYGNLVTISGYQWFCRYNLNLMANRQNLIANAPADPTSNYTPLITFTVPTFPATWGIEIDPAPAGNESLLVQTKINRSKSVIDPPLPLQFLRSVKPGDGSVLNMNPDSIIFVEGQSQWAGVKPVDAFGRTSGWVYTGQWTVV